MPSTNAHAPSPINCELLRTRADPSLYNFATTDELDDFDGFVGQNRALSSAQFGINIECDGFNIFALGPNGVGKRSIIKALLEQEAIKKPQAQDICYVHNFKDHRYPSILMLKAGMGKILADDMQHLIEILKTTIPAIFENPDYVSRLKQIQSTYRHKQEESFIELEKIAGQHQIAIIRTPDGFMLAPTKDGEVIPDDKFAALPQEEREEKELLMRKLHTELANFFEKIPVWQKEERQKIRETLMYFTVLQVGSVINELKRKYDTNNDIISYLNDVQQAILDSPNDFRKSAKDSHTPLLTSSEDPVFNRYRINVLIDNSATKGAPIIYEDMPNYTNIVGRVEQISHLGSLISDFMLIRPGAFHKAHGGYLLVDAVKLLSQPYAWDALKRILFAKKIKIENFYQGLGIMGTTSIEPEAMPLQVKVVLFGERHVYHLLCAYDRDFPDLFKVAADFDDDIAINPHNNLLFVKLLKNITQRHHIRPITKNGVMAIHEYASRLSGDAEKLSMHVQKLCDLLREADFYAMQNNQAFVDAEAIEKAIAQQIYRAARVRDKYYETIQRGIVLIDSAAEAIGQINGLAYIEIGGLAFAYPARITARCGIGPSRIIDIQREVKLSGPIHSKGVMILAGYLHGKYAHDEHIALSASLVFEQNYSGVEGDSATLAETIALLSSIGGIPIKQNIAITGSMNQHGNAQAIGGVNEKIEGFFDICSARNLNGSHGVIIPEANIKNLNLRKDVVDACSDKRFFVWSVSSVEQALSIMSGLSESECEKKIGAALKNFAKKAKSKKSE